MAIMMEMLQQILGKSGNASSDSAVPANSNVDPPSIELDARSQKHTGSKVVTKNVDALTELPVDLYNALERAGRQARRRGQHRRVGDNVLGVKALRLAGASAPSPQLNV